jgi:hypothetical protein
MAEGVGFESSRRFPCSALAASEAKARRGNGGNDDIAAVLDHDSIATLMLDRSAGLNARAHRLFIAPRDPPPSTPMAPTGSLGLCATTSAPLTSGEGVIAGVAERPHRAQFP